MRNRGRSDVPALLVAALAVTAATGRAGAAEISELHVAIGATFGITEARIDWVRAKGISDDELAPVAVIAERAAVPVETVVQFRLDGASWLDVAVHFGLGPEIFYVPFERDPGPPYGKAWGYYKKTPRAEWRTIRLSDVDVVNFANLQLCTRTYGVTAARVVELQRGHGGFVAVHRELHAARGKGPADRRGKGRGKGKPPKDDGKPPRTRG